VPVPGVRLALSLIAALGLSIPAEANPRLQGSQGHYSVSVFVPVTLQRAWQVLSNYEGMAGVMPDIQQAKVISRQGKTLVLAQTYQAPYTFGLRIQARLLVEETPPTQLRYTLIRGDRIRQLRGRWTLSPVAGGVQVRHQIEVEPELPALLRPSYNELSEANLVQSMQVLRRLMVQR
jgi:hypothetical protein